jgi:hypothetical protein
MLTILADIARSMAEKRIVAPVTSRQTTRTI